MINPLPLSSHHHLHPSSSPLRPGKLVWLLKFCEIFGDLISKLQILATLTAAKFSMSAHSHFPIELQDCVIAHLWEDHDTLAICSLVSSQWLKLARTLLFFDFKLQLSLLYHAESAKYQEFKTLLQAPHSRLGPYIRQLELSGIENNLPTPPNAVTAARDLYSHFSVELLSILPLLTCVADLTLQSIGWANLSSDAIGAICSLSGVIFLKWIGCSSSLDDLMLVSDGFPALQTLQIVNFKEIGPGSSLSQPPKSFEKVQSLNIIGQEEVMVGRLLKPAFSLPFHSSNITELALYFAYTGGKDVASILHALGPKLVSLSFKILTSHSVSRIAQDFPISLANNINLKTLMFPTLANHDMWWLDLLLKTVSDEHNLEEIEFSVRPFDEHSPVRMEDIILRVVKPQTKVTCNIGWLSSMGAQTLTREMPELTKRGQLWADYHVLKSTRGRKQGIWSRVTSFTPVTTKRLCLEE